MVHIIFTRVHLKNTYEIYATQLTVQKHRVRDAKRRQTVNACRKQSYVNTITGGLQFPRNGAAVLPAPIVRLSRPLVNLDVTLVAREWIRHFVRCPTNVELDETARQ